ncbi:MAG TPA: fibrillarin-like rRNA/tRNA 2'-O-methyltransferase [Thermoplasmata archaeon]|nr:fibrillarin-like rRNA/tRNA 2'-O-methyltransferase [Thermoplasmata archaeon]
MKQKGEEMKIIQTDNPNIYKGFEKVGDVEEPYFTKAIDDFRFYKEYRVVWKGEEYRYWNPHKSKWALHVRKKEVRSLLKSDISLLYLGAATGTSLSHLADVVKKGKLYAVEFSSTSFRRLKILGEKRSNVFPLLFDASRPEAYLDLVAPVDLLYMDISQPNQWDIFRKNLEIFLKKNGTALFVLKERSLTLRQKPSEIKKEIEKEMKEHDLSILLKYDLHPYHKDHLTYVLKQR